MKSDLLPDIMNVLVNVDIPFVSKKQEDIVYRDIFWNSIIYRIFDKDWGNRFGSQYPNLFGSVFT